MSLGGVTFHSDPCKPPVRGMGHPLPPVYSPVKSSALHMKQRHRELKSQFLQLQDDARTPGRDSYEAVAMHVQILHVADAQ